MLKVYPDYYDSFKCLMGDCRHNCCIGWEIDIDSLSAEHYKSVSGRFGERLKSNIEWSEQPYFKLADNERCPFLNKDNLCDIIINLGQEHLCDICDLHPRFVNHLPDRVEIGLGLSCEAAARLVLGWKEPVKLSAENSSDEIIIVRDKAIDILQDRKRSIKERVELMLDTCFAAPIEQDISLWAKRFKALEQLDSEWDKLLNLITEGVSEDILNQFDTYMSDRQGEYEQLLVYLIYRHLANAPDAESVAARASFAALGCLILRAMGAALWYSQGQFTFEHQVELVRLFSSEIEYSDENLYILLDNEVNPKV